MKLTDLVGYQLVSINDDKIVVKKDGIEYELQLHDYPGDCCGYNEIESELFISSTELSRNPIITNVVVEDNGSNWGNRGKLTFFGEVKAMAEVNTYSSSGSGWCYGAAVSVVCDALELDECLSEY